MKNPKVLASARISSQNQIVVPSIVRKKLSTQSGDLLLFIEEDNKIWITVSIKEI